MLEPRRAVVRPRVISPHSGETLLLEDEILSLVERGRTGVVWLTGGAGSGKTTALAHMAAVLPASARVILLDDNHPRPGEPGRLTVGSGYRDSAPAYAMANYELAGWGDDEVLEYLLAAHCERCNSVLQRCGPTQKRQLLEGSPTLWRLVLDCLAEDEEIPTVREALVRVVHRSVPAGPVRELAADWGLGLLGGNVQLSMDSDTALEKICDHQSLKRLLVFMDVVLILTSERTAEELRNRGPCEFLTYRLHTNLVREAAAVIRDVPAALKHLRGVVANRNAPGAHAMAASLLHAAGFGWRPEPLPKSALRKLLPGKKQSLPLLRGAHLANADWSGVALSHADICDADLSGANLANATLDDANAKGARLGGARLSGASLVRICADSAIFAGADLSYIRAAQSSFDSADAQGASFEGALLGYACFRGAKLGRANFARANLTEADFVDAEIEGADFSQAQFAGACLAGLALRLAEFRQCRFREAEMVGCDLEGMVLPGADFRQANLQEALLTGSVMPRTDFRGATLVNAGLADIDWEFADLRDADLRGASFHMGSSRSGLVDSPIASYGSRTGYYTDDYNDQGYKPPEEIRKANLRGADLRSAKVSGVDFYLVDLRDAEYDAAQEEQFRSSGAILESRVE